MRKSAMVSAADTDRSGGGFLEQGALLETSEPIRRTSEIEEITNLYLIHPIASFLTPIFVKLGISANAVSLAGMALGGLAGVAYYNYLDARWAIAGAALGLLGAWFCARLLESLLFEVRAHDPLLLSLALFVLLTVAFLAAWIPARRAMRVDPMVALRYE